MLITERPGSGGSGGIPPDLVGSGIQWVPVLVATVATGPLLVGTGCGFVDFVDFVDVVWISVFRFDTWD